MKIRNFLIHLRLHYQFFILSGGYLLGGLYSPRVEWREFLLQFLNVHVLLFGGATAFNSYWDKDEGAIGGLKRPPPLLPWMRPASLALGLVGGAFALMSGTGFFLVYALSALLFWLYSTPHARWKGRPILSLIAIGVSTGTNSFWLGYWAAGSRNPATLGAWVASLAVAAVLLSVYPISQIYQIQEDQKRGDQTFAARYGLGGVRRFFVVAFPLGITGLTLSWVLRSPGLPGFVVGGVLGLIGIGVGLGIWKSLSTLTGTMDEYERVMSIKYRTSLSFVSFLMACHLLLAATPM